MPGRRSANSWLWAGSIVVLIDVAQFVVILLRRWEGLSSYVVYLLSAGIIGLLLFWYLALLSQKQISQLVKDDVSEPSGAAAAMVNAALSIGTNIAIRGLFVYGLSVSFLLRAVFKLSRVG